MVRVFSAAIIFFALSCVATLADPGELRLKFGRSSEIGPFLNIEYQNISDHAYCAREKEWSVVGMLLSLQLYDDEGRPISTKPFGYPGWFGPDTRGEPFYIVPPGEALRFRLYLERHFDSYYIDNHEITAKMAFPFIRCSVFDGGHVEYPTINLAQMPLSADFIREVNEIYQSEEELSNSLHIAYTETALNNLQKD